MLDWTHIEKKTAPLPSAVSTEVSGLMVGTPVATVFGWRPIEAICVGDMVLTFDHSFRAVKALRRVVLWDGEGECPQAIRPLSVQAGVLPDAGAVVVLPDQGVMVESDAAENYRGDPFAVICPRSIEDFGLAEPMAVTGPIEAIVLEFEDDEVIYGQNGLLYHMPRSFDLLADVNPSTIYKVLNAAEAQTVLEELYETYLDA